jgi:branched-chain amino acid transport system permease protein
VKSPARWLDAGADAPPGARELLGVATPAPAFTDELRFRLGAGVAKTATLPVAAAWPALLLKGLAVAAIGGASGFLYMVAVQYTSPETMSFAHSISLVAAMVIGGAASIVGSLLGGAYYVLVPQFTNTIDASLTLVIQGVILLAVLFLLPGGLVSLPRTIRRLTRRRGGGSAAGTSGARTGPIPQTTPVPPAPAGTAREQPENPEPYDTERQG